MNNKILTIIFLFTLNLNSAFAGSCEGKGTVFFFGNGMFTTKDSAKVSRDRLREAIHQSVSLENSKDIRYEIAYKDNEFVPFQVLNVAKHKEIDNWENFWLWLSSFKEPPKWFQGSMKSFAAEALKHGHVAFDGIQEHWEQYARYIRKGYNIVLVSHSQGNLYANQTMRKLAKYTDASLTGSISEKRRENLNFPEFADLFSNVQVATPVMATVNSAPWNTFKDDLIMLLVRETLKALPPNLSSPGIGLPPDGDLLGHQFIKAYLRNPEAKGKILSDIQTQYNKLKYPIAYFQQAVTLQSHWRHYGEGNNLDSPDADLHFSIKGPDGQLVDGADEVRPNDHEIVSKAFLDCYELPLGTSTIFLSVYNDKKLKEVSFDVFPNGENKGEKPQVITMPIPVGTSDWEVGTIQAEKGRGKEPLSVKVEIYSQPKSRAHP